MVKLEILKTSQQEKQLLCSVEPEVNEYWKIVAQFFLGFETDPISLKPDKRKRHIFCQDDLQIKFPAGLR